MITGGNDSLAFRRRLAESRASFLATPTARSASALGSTPGLEIVNAVSSISAVKPVVMPAVTGNVPQTFDLANKTIANNNEVIKSDINLIAKSGGVSGHSGITPALQIDQKAIVSKLTVGTIATSDPFQIAATAADSVRYRDKISFSPFRFNVWNRSAGGAVDSSGVQGGVNDRELVLGRWYLEFDAPDAGKFVAFDGAIQIDVSGKKVLIEKALYVPPAVAGGKGTLKLQINILENPLPLLALIAVAAGALGIGGWGLAAGLKQVDKIIVDSTWIIIGGLVLAGVIFWPKIKRGFAS